CTDCLEHVLNRDGSVVEHARLNRSSVEDQSWNVEPYQRHQGAGNGLVAADNRYEAIEEIAACDELYRVGDDFAAYQRGAHPLRQGRASQLPIAFGCRAHDSSCRNEWVTGADCWKKAGRCSSRDPSRERR